MGKAISSSMCVPGQSEGVIIFEALIPGKVWRSGTFRRRRGRGAGPMSNQGGNKDIHTETDEGVLQVLLCTAVTTISESS